MRTMHAVGGGAALGQIEDKYSAAAFGDVLFRGGGPKGAELMQGAINDTIKDIGPEEAARVGVGPVAEDRIMGPRTFNAYKALSNAGHGRKLRDKLSDRRDDEWPKEKRRNDYVRYRAKRER
jgi:hypothetical protein